MAQSLSVKFLNAKFFPHHKVKLQKGERLYPWRSIGWNRDEYGPIETGGSPGQEYFALHEGYASKWLAVVGVLTGGIGAYLFGGAFRREEVYECNRNNVTRIVRITIPFEYLDRYVKKAGWYGNMEGFGDWVGWPENLKKDRPRAAIMYRLYTRSGQRTDVHLFKLDWNQSLSSRELYEQAQQHLDKLLTSVVPQDIVADETIS